MERNNRMIALMIVFTLGAVSVSPSRCFADDSAPPTLAGRSFLTVPGQQWRLRWHDEFPGDHLDTNKWTSGLPWRGDDGAHRHHNPQYASLISDNDIVVDKGNLELFTRKEDTVDQRGRVYHYTQAFIQTEGKFSYTYGYCEIQAKVPIEAGPALWPAFWTLSQGWPPEDDIAEFWTGRPLPHFHQGLAFKVAGNPVEWVSRHRDEVPTGYHTYGLEWGPGYQLFNFDGNITVRAFGTNVPSVPMYLILNTGVTSDPLPLRTTIFPNAFIVKYVRVYSRPDVIPVHNPGFEDVELAPWEAWNNAVVTPTNPHSGTYALCLRGSPSSAEQTIFGLCGGRHYYLTAWVDPANDGELRLGAKNYKGPEVWTSTTGSGYRQVRIEFVTGTDATTATIYCFKPTGNKEGYFDDIMVMPLDFNERPRVGH